MENPSGIQPIEFKCLVEPLESENKIGSILLPDETAERQQYAQMKGRIVAVSPMAFPADEYGEMRPGPGTLVLMAKYAGVEVTGEDKKKYKLINDKDVAAIIEE